MSSGWTGPLAHFAAKASMKEFEKRTRLEKSLSYISSQFRFPYTLHATQCSILSPASAKPTIRLLILLQGMQLYDTKISSFSI